MEMRKAAPKKEAAAFHSIIAVLGEGHNDDGTLTKDARTNVEKAVELFKGGVADKRFIEACPWLIIEPDMPLKINGGDFLLYQLATYYYMIELRLRINSFIGRKKSKYLTNLLNKTCNLITEILLHRGEEGQIEE